MTTMSFDSVTSEITRLVTRFVAAFVSHTPENDSPSSEQLDRVEQVTWVIRLGECEVLTVAH